MACACGQCLEHARMIGLPRAPSTRAALRKAFRAQAKLWHPDRFEADPARRLEAEEHFKGIQVAYRELWEHFDPSPEPIPEENPPPSPPPANPPAAEPQNEPAHFFAGIPGCYAGPYFPSGAQHILTEHLHDNERALAIVDLSMRGSHESFSRYIFFTSSRILVRDSSSIVSLLWYADLGDVFFVDQKKRGLAGIWQKLADRLMGSESRYSLEIDRSNGAHFYSIAAGTDDSVKKVIYNFLRQKKHPPVH